MQNSSIFCDSSAKSTHDQTMALSLPPCSLIVVPGMTASEGAVAGWQAEMFLYTGAACRTRLERAAITTKQATGSARHG